MGMGMDVVVVVAGLIAGWVAGAVVVDGGVIIGVVVMARLPPAVQESVAVLEALSPALIGSSPMAIGKSIMLSWPVTANRARERERGLEAARAERARHRAEGRGTNIHTALFAAIQEEVDAIDTHAIRRARIGRHSLDNGVAHLNPGARPRVGELEVDRRAVGGRHAGRALGEGWQAADAKRRGHGQRADQAEVSQCR
jgi:hypothetical protein